ncbi:MAG: rhodanese-like domain-containing protein [Bacteroidales bacterium]|nr:rhodanese-like domain-containing protein [Bacteroidales bacterium]
MVTYNKPIFQDFNIEQVMHISPSEANDVLKNNEAILIDVREQDEILTENIPLENVLYHPMSVILDRLAYIAKDQHIILGCPAGIRSTKVANLMILNGYPHVANLDGGFNEWKQQGFPYEANMSLGIGCGCDVPPEKSSDPKCC